LSVVDDLRKVLGLPAAPQLPELLDSHSVEVEAFLLAFLAVVEPYVDMWSDLLAMFERAAAFQGRDQLDIAYDFGGSDPELRFNLDHFRSAVSLFRHVSARFNFDDVTTDDFWKLTRVFQHIKGDAFFIDSVGDVDIDQFARACREDLWPARLPRLPRSTGTRPFDDLVAELWALCDVFLESLRATWVSYADLSDRRQISSNREPLATNVVISAERLREVEHDHWLPALVTTVATVVISGGHDWDTAAADLDEAIATFRNRDPDKTILQKQVEDILSLPLWEHRHELYSNWVCTQVLQALETEVPRLFSVNGRLTFSFAGTHLATFDRFDPRLHLWTELRSPLANPVAKKGRTKAIQPDITLVADPITATDQAPVTIECKQYGKASTRNFADALTDYAHGRPLSLVLLASYGIVDEDTILDRVADDVQARVRVFSELRPGSASATEFQSAIRLKLGLNSTTRSITLPCKIVLTWGELPQDLDISILLKFDDGSQRRISFRDLGSTDEFPWIALDRDVRHGFGPETVTITEFIPGAQYTVEVAAYSHETSIRESGATVTVSAASGERVAVTCPEDLKSESWCPMIILDSGLQVLD
jgi:hypothetical protein